MTCGSCGATIAEKAIVCYRCGVPTALPPPPVRPVPRPAVPRWVGPLVVAIIIGLGVWLAPKTAEDSWERIAVFVALALVTFVSVRLIRRR
jgi:hypothetical protein